MAETGASNVAETRAKLRLQTQRCLTVLVGRFSTDSDYLRTSSG